MGSGKSKLKYLKSQLSVCTLEGTYTRASRIGGYFPQLLKYQDFWSIKSMLKKFYCISEAPLDVLKFELWFVIENLFPQKAVAFLML